MKRIPLAALAALAPLSLGAAAAAAAEGGRSVSWTHEAPRGAVTTAWSHRRPGIRLWTSSGEVYRRGERLRVFYRTERDAYVTIFRVDTDGRVRILFPAHPSDDNFVAGGRSYSVYGYGHDAFVVDDYPGVGYVFGVASDAPFLYDRMITGGRWDYSLISDGRIHGDPYQSLEEVAVELLPPQYDEFDTHLLPYYVERRYDYPRFVCYDCHAYTSYHSWDPYSVFCSRFSLVIWRDPYYYYPSYWYPGRYYGGTRVVYVRPGVVVRDSRYVFKTRESSDPGVQYRDRRLNEPSGRQPPERYVRGADIGGTGTVPVPGGRRVAPIGRDGVTPEPREPQTRDPIVVRGRRTPAAEPNQPRAGGRAPEERRGAEPRAGAVIPEQRPERRDAPRGGLEPQQGERRRPDERPAGTGQVERAPERREAQRPDARPAERPDAGERRPSGAGATVPRERQPERQPESRPERRPESRPEPRAEPRASRPEPRSQPQARPSAPSRPSSPPSNPGLVRRRPE